MSVPLPQSAVTRRRFLRESFGFSALAALGSRSRAAGGLPTGPATVDILMIGDWGYTNATAQTAVAKAQQTSLAHAYAPQPQSQAQTTWNSIRPSGRY